MRPVLVVTGNGRPIYNIHRFTKTESSLYTIGMTLQEIQDRTMDVLRKHLSHGERVALVDFPNHGNSGDSLIYLGQLRYLEKLGISVDYVADASRYSPKDLRSRVPQGPILIQGGGNFGDRWKPMQAMRERVISDFPERKIIQLPQGIDFQEGPDLEHAQKVLGNHRNLTLLIRDSAGVQRTKELFTNANVEFCPDLAFGYGEISPSRPSTVSVVCLKRRDSESTGGFPDLDRENVETDWGLRGWRRTLGLAARMPGAIGKRLPIAASYLYPVQRRCYDFLAELHVKNAVHLLSQGRVVVTDRLHATVLAGLMHKPVVAIDNANGKVRAIFEEYLSSLPNVYFEQDSSRVNSRVADVLLG